jgi:hypothetical protein
MECLPNGVRYRLSGVDNAWVQEEPEARKMLENAARRLCGWQSPASSE